MSEVDRLFKQYMAEHRAGGEADPRAFLDQLEGVDRAELAALLDAYLARSPGHQGWDPQAFAGSPAELLTERLDRSLQGQAGMWPAVLPRLRERAKVARDDVVRRMAEALGVAEREQKVAEYYHEMEQGTLPSRGVSDRVLTALGDIVGASAERLREAGEGFGGAATVDSAAVFARTAKLDKRYAAAAPPPSESELVAEWDEVDTLFRGG